MVKKLALPQTRHNVFVFDEDWELLKSLYGPDGEHPEVGTSRAIRAILHAKCEDLRAKMAQAMEQAAVEVNNQQARAQA